MGIMLKEPGTRGCLASFAAAFLCLGLGATSGRAATGDPFGPVMAPKENPLTQEKIDLGRELFTDVRVSSNDTVACATCHRPDLGGSSPSAPHPGADGIPGTADDPLGSIGIQGQTTGRQAPSTLGSAAFLKLLFWDGRAGPDFENPTNPGEIVAFCAAAEKQATGPELANREMAFDNRTWTDVLTKLAGLNGHLSGTPYTQLFADAFGDAVPSAASLTAARVGMAIASYERTLIPDQSPFQLMAASGNDGFLTAQQLRGFDVFRGQGRCDKCHIDGILSDGLFHNNGFSPIEDDLGRFNVTRRKKDRGAFKTSPLYGVGQSAPYMHDGRFATLMDVVDAYDRGGDFHENQDALIRPLGLSVPEKLDLVAFLEQALTDPRALNNLPPFTIPALATPVPGADAVAPVVAVVAPCIPNPLNGIVKFVAEVTDDQNIKRVTFQVDALGVVEDVIAPFRTSVDTTLLATGAHTMTVKAEDFGGNVTCHVEPFMVDNAAADVVPPEILKIISPHDKFPFGGAIVPAEVEVCDNIAVDRVEYRLDGALVATGMAPDFAATFAGTRPAGTYTFEATAFDTTGNASDPVSVDIEISNLRGFPVTALQIAAEGLMGAGDFCILGTFTVNSSRLVFTGVGLPAPASAAGYRLQLVGNLGVTNFPQRVRLNALGNVTNALLVSPSQADRRRRAFWAEEICIYDGMNLVATAPVAVEVALVGTASFGTTLGVPFLFTADFCSTGPGEGHVVAALESTAIAPAGDYVIDLIGRDGMIQLPFTLDVAGLIHEEFTRFTDFVSVIGRPRRVTLHHNGVQVGTRLLSLTIPPP